MAHMLGIPPSDAVRRSYKTKEIPRGSTWPFPPLIKTIPIPASYLLVSVSTLLRRGSFVGSWITDRNDSDQSALI